MRLFIVFVRFNGFNYKCSITAVHSGVRALFNSLLINLCRSYCVGCLLVLFVCPSGPCYIAPV